MWTFIFCVLVSFCWALPTEQSVVMPMSQEKEDALLPADIFGNYTEETKTPDVKLDPVTPEESEAMSICNDELLKIALSMEFGNDTEETKTPDVNLEPVTPEEAMSICRDELLDIALSKAFGNDTEETKTPDVNLDPVTPGSKSFRSDYKYYEEVDGWFKFHQVPAIWHEAQLRCHMEGSVLASPIDSSMARALKSFIRKKRVEDRIMLTGVHATFSNGDFFSIEGVPLRAMPVEWTYHEPDNFNNKEQCITFNHYGYIGDVDCNEVFPYICFHKDTKAALTACGTTDPEYVLNPKTGNCYKFHRNTRPWKRAFMSCAAEGGYLAIPNSEEEAKYMKEIFDKNPSNTIVQVHEGIMRDIMHIGFHDWNERADWRTIHGESLESAGYSNFAGIDNATAGKFCGGMLRTGQLDDVWCHEVGPYLCEKSPDTLVEIPLISDTVIYTPR